MRIIGCDLRAAQQTIAMLDRETGEIVERTLKHEGTTVRDFYAGPPAPIVVGIEATGSMGWFVRLMEELGVRCQGSGFDSQPHLIQKQRPTLSEHPPRIPASRCTISFRDFNFRSTPFSRLQYFSRSRLDCCVKRTDRGREP